MMSVVDYSNVRTFLSRRMLMRESSWGREITLGVWGV